MKPNRLGSVAKITEVDGLKFASKKEARRWGELCMLEGAGEIVGLERQVSLPLMGQDGPILTPTGRVMQYRADFIYREKGRPVVEDAKGHRTEIYLLKKAILAAQGIVIRET